jgi:hypothetical protein
VKKVRSTRRKPGRQPSQFWAYPNATYSPEVSNARTEARILLGDNFDRLCAAIAGWRTVPDRHGAAWWRELRLASARAAVAQLLAVDPLDAMLDLFPEHVETIPKFETEPSVRVTITRELRSDHPARVEGERLRAAFTTAREALNAAQKSVDAINAMNPDTSPALKRMQSHEDVILRALSPRYDATATGIAYFEIAEGLVPPYRATDDGREQFNARVRYWKQELKRARRKRPRVVT